MPLLTVSNVSHAYGTHAVLDGATFSIEPGEKIGLVGRNGQGKTTLMKVIMGMLKPDGGSVQLQRGARVGYLSQETDLDPEDTLRDAAERAFAELHDLHVQSHALYEQMATAEGEVLDRILKAQSRLDAAIEAAGGYAIDHRIDAMLHGLGFTDDQFALKVAVLSGGQKGRLSLAKLLLESPDLLLLDEPTNHLDIAGRQWLEEFLSEEYAGAVIVVSHDRWLLDRVVSRIVEVERGAIREYPGNYHKYLDLRRERQLTEARVYDKQRDKVRQEKQFIARYKTGQRAKQARGRQSRLDRFVRDEMVDRPIELDVMNLKLPKSQRSGDLVIVAEGISKGYDGKQLFSDLDVTIKRGERIGIIGPNGVGKTTLIRILLDELEPDEGSVRQGSKLNIGYFRQMRDHLDPTLTVWQYLQSVIVGMDGQAKASEQQARDLAGAFLFSGQDQDKLLGDMSGGERSRAVLAGLVASENNLLVLDEPTNHFDIPSMERVEQTLSREGGYEGTVLLISHDRALLQAVCDELIVFDGQGGVTFFQGRLLDWLEKERKQAGQARQSNAQRSAADKQAARKGQDRSKPASGRSSSSSSSSGGGGGGGGGRGSDDDQLRNRLARMSLKNLEQEIERIEQAVRAIDGDMLDPDVYTDGPRVKALQAQRVALQKELEPLEFEWAARVDEN